ncbi:hypothetical protein [Nisaea sp.]|uniref:hypothetical protein n=1 Tax=Nisaea sp. TaxID=2024842 RepID=UPI0032ECCA26
MGIQIEDHGTFVEFVGLETVRPSDVFEAVSGYYPESPKKLALWNFMAADLSGFSADEFKIVAANGARFAASRGDGARTAVATKSNPEFLLIRAFIARADLASTITFEVFTSRQDAVRWLFQQNSAPFTTG